MNSLRHAKHFQRGDTSPRMCREARGPFPTIRSAGPTRHAWMAVLILGLVLPACSHWRESYLQSGVQNISQDDVIDRFGEPWKKKDSILNGQATWIYRYALTEDELDPLGVNALRQGMRQATDTLALTQEENAGPKNRPKCFHYILTFDKTKILNHWGREECATTSL